MSNTTNVNIRGVKRPVKDLFHAACLRRGKTMKDVIVDFMKRYAEKEGNLNGRKG